MDNEQKSRMYANTKTWNPFVGCRYNCIYCKPSFQAQLKRRKKACLECYNYHPHKHEERLNIIPSAKIVFVSGCGDISFCSSEYTYRIIDRIKEHNSKCPYKTYYFQSKNPRYFKQFLEVFPDNVILLTTLETNRDENYEEISKAPKPSVRYRDFLQLDYPRKVITIEPLMDFDLDIFTEWIVRINPEYVWLGFNSRPKQVQLPEPSLEKAQKLIEKLKDNGIEIKPRCETRELKF
ncbi:MAG: hypothetical protein DRO95_06380 [Candidatus Altiarchaeales archaeon]|nr:MAG: hypothetical protein DRO95_06380 [Candidatus Altiarchaeales archaeon]